MVSCRSLQKGRVLFQWRCLVSRIHTHTEVCWLDFRPECLQYSPFCLSFSLFTLSLFALFPICLYGHLLIFVFIRNSLQCPSLSHTHTYPSCHVRLLSIPSFCILRYHQLSHPLFNLCLSLSLSLFLSPSLPLKSSWPIPLVLWKCQWCAGYQEVGVYLVSSAWLGCQSASSLGDRLYSSTSSLLQASSLIAAPLAVQPDVKKYLLGVRLVWTES